jgi:toxin ParE1/3/4
VSYRLTPRAVEDIEAIAAYVGEQNATAAANLVRSFIDRFELAAEYPYLGMSREDIIPGLRHLVLGTYLTFYRLEAGDVVVLRVLHGRREISNQDIS